ncbi:hypothetical protein [Leuconostoc mesenteroides]|uniref:hypothetical protein n=1 Tax=Leuconostoc mesenteroides TaxID=1245 RepID=UPI0022E84FFC|nr:hypothetical protein [Leuconostoc mesenteroides]
MRYFFKLCVCALAAFIASLVVLDNSGIGTLGEWAGAIFSGAAVLLAVNNSRTILGAEFMFRRPPFIIESMGIKRELHLNIENKSNFEVKVDSVSIIFKSRFLRRQIGEYSLCNFHIEPATLKPHDILEVPEGFSMHMVNDPIIHYKKVRADAVIYFANKKTVILVDQLVYTDGMIVWNDKEVTK